MRYQYDYLAITDEGAFAPGAEPGWNPAADKEPIAVGIKSTKRTVGNPGDTGVRILECEKGSGAWRPALPEHWKDLSQVISGAPAQVDIPFYQYEGDPKSTLQNVYRNSQALRYDDKRCVAVLFTTKGIDDTGPGYMDYKLWYRVSTDGGKTYDAERPLVQEGAQFSPMHPNRYVWAGRNSYCYAAIPPFVKLSNGDILLPFYFAPLDKDGKYHNPVGAFTFSWVACLIGRWNEAGNDVTWDVSEDVRLSGEQSSRGSNECAVMELKKPGHVLLIIRASNEPDPRGNLPAWKWKALSTDYGRTWTAPTPLAYDDGEEFWSPSIMLQHDPQFPHRQGVLDRQHQPHVPPGQRSPLPAGDGGGG